MILDIPLSLTRTAFTSYWTLVGGYQATFPFILVNRHVHIRDEDHISIKPGLHMLGAVVSEEKKRDEGQNLFDYRTQLYNLQLWQCCSFLILSGEVSKVKFCLLFCWVWPSSIHAS